MGATGGGVGAGGAGGAGGATGMAAAGVTGVISAVAACLGDGAAVAGSSDASIAPPSCETWRVAGGSSVLALLELRLISRMK